MMVDKEQIEELASNLRKILYTLRYGIDADNIPLKEVSKELLKHYQPKIDKDKVVLTREGYDILIAVENTRINEAKEQARKAMATEIYKLSEEWLGGIAFWNKVRKLCKEYGAEVEKPVSDEDEPWCEGWTSPSDCNTCPMVECNCNPRNKCNKPAKELTMYNANAFKVKLEDGTDAYVEEQEHC
jgi:hypothetical protein